MTATRTLLVRTSADSYRQLTVTEEDARAALEWDPVKTARRLAGGGPLDADLVRRHLIVTETTTGDVWLVGPPSGRAAHDLDASLFMNAADFAAILDAFAALDAGE